MSEKDLIPFSQRTEAEQRAIRSKGGKTVTEKQILAQRWRQYKKRLKLGKIESENPKWLIDRIEDDKSFAVDMLRDLDKLEKESEFPTDKLLFLKNRIYQSLHGTKLSGEFKHQHDIRAITYNINNPNDKYPRIEEED